MTSIGFVEANNVSTWSTNEDINAFREYLRIPSVHPNVDYGKKWNNKVK